MKPGEKDIAACFREDLAMYKSSAVYGCLTETFPRSIAPTIYDGLHAPCTNATAVQWGCTNAIDQVFYEIWRAAYVTSCLRADWDKKISATVTTAREENGRYYTDVNLFIEPGIRDYLAGIDFKGTNGWSKRARPRTVRCISLPQPGRRTRTDASGTCTGRRGRSAA